MSFLGVRDALLARLTGRSQNDVGADLNATAGRGLVAPVRAQANRGAAARGPVRIGFLGLPTTPGLLGVKIPVVPYDLAGRNYEERPVVSVYLARPPEARRDASYLFTDPIDSVVASSMMEVTDTEDGTVTRGPTQLKRREHPRPYDYVFTIRVWATSETEGVLIHERIMDLLDGRGYLDVTLRDGSTVTYDTEMSEDAPTIDMPPGMEEAGDAGDYSILAEYTVEGYRDNSDAAVIINTILSRTLIVADMADDGEEARESTVILDAAATPADD